MRNDHEVLCRPGRGLEETAIRIIDSDERTVRKLKAFSEPEALVDVLRARALGYAGVGLEACPLAPWVFEHLATAGLPVVCLEVRHFRAALAAMTHKTARNDARSIDQILRTGSFKAVQVKSPTPTTEGPTTFSRRRLQAAEQEPSKFPTPR